MWQRGNRPVAPSIYADAAASRRREVEGRTNRELSSYGVVGLALSIIFCIIPVVHRGWGRPMMTILIGAGVSGFVLGATSRIIFLLPAALMALVVAGVLIVRADIDLGFTALAASLLNGGFLLGVVMAPDAVCWSRRAGRLTRPMPALWLAIKMAGRGPVSVSASRAANLQLATCSPATRRGGSPPTIAKLPDLLKRPQY